MSKYVIDTTLDSVKKVIAMGVTKGGAIWTDTTDIENLEELNSDYINEHFGDLQDTAYQRGLEDGKAVNDKGCDGCKYAEMGSDTTICAECCNAYHNQWTAKDDKIEVGDEVKSLSDSGVEIEGLLPWVVTTVDQGDYCQGIDSKGEVHATKKVRACKTGRHFDIEKILEDMRK